MSDFDTVGKEIHSDAASEALDRIEARLSTAEKALREAMDILRAAYAELPGTNRLSSFSTVDFLARNALTDTEWKPTETGTEKQWSEWVRSEEGQRISELATMSDCAACGLSLWTSDTFFLRWDGWTALKYHPACWADRADVDSPRNA